MNVYKRHRFPPDVISYAVWLYHRFNLSHRDIEDLLAERQGGEPIFSAGWSGVMDPSPGKSSPTSWAVIGLPIGN